MDLRAGTAGTRVAHLPKVVVLVAVDDMVGGHVFGPVFCGFVVAGNVLLGAAFEHCHVEVGRVEVKHVDEVFPSVVDGAFLEVVAKAPVAEHFKHGVVVGVVPHLFQIVVFAAYAQAFL